MTDLRNKSDVALNWYIEAMKETYKERALTEKEADTLFACIEELRSRTK